MERIWHILVVDNHGDIRDSLSQYLTRHGYRVSSAADAAGARGLLAKSAIDLVVLDIMMPGEDGLSLCRDLRHSGNLPIILLTAVADDTDRVIGLEMGADDYVTKPFNPRELLARIKALVHRTQSLPPGDPAPRGDQISLAGWVLDAGRRELMGEDQVAVPLSTGEFKLLGAFLNHPNMVLSRDQLLDLTAGRDAKMFDRAIDNQVSRLRRKLEEDPKNPVLIKTVWGGGYLLNAKVGRA
ncbi:MAG: response regulator [Rhodospirillales bacterium]|jgi:two-component system OmpR family response regulator|nr:response regulator [Rhodospirillales bacterium]